MLTKAVTIKHIEELQPGGLFFYPELGRGLLCIAGIWGGQEGAATAVVPLTGLDSSPYTLHPMRVDNLMGQAVLADGYIAQVDLSSANIIGIAPAYVASGKTYIGLQAERSFQRSFLCLDDGNICSSLPGGAMGFDRWRIVSQEDHDEELWSSDLIPNSNTEEK